MLKNAPNCTIKKQLRGGGGHAPNPLESNFAACNSLRPPKKLEPPPPPPPLTNPAYAHGLSNIFK